MLFHRVVRPCAKRNARDATVARQFVALARHRAGWPHCAAPVLRGKMGFSFIACMIARKISLMIKRKILFLWGN
jgi:hypothetical protein